MQQGCGSAPQPTSPAAQLASGTWAMISVHLWMQRAGTRIVDETSSRPPTPV
jgi:hypothetical protein